MRRLALGLAALCCACAGARVPQVGEPAPKLADEAAESAYQQTLENYTSHREIYCGLDTRIFAAMTYQSPRFVEARVRRQGAFLKQPAAVVDQNVAAAQAEAAPYYEFFLGVHLNNTRYDDFDKRPSSWRLALLTANGDVTPIEVQRVGRSNLNLRALYPYLDDFWVGYRVRFPRALPTGEPVEPAGASRLTVRMASALGHTEFEFPAR
ncbi:MAG: hypothetical protein ACYC8T_19450 [Myxococcaceae bacterium]